MGIGGAERMALQLCEHFDRSRIEPLLLVFRDPGPSTAVLQRCGVRWFVLPKRGKLPLAFWLALRRLLVREKVDACLSLLQGTNVHNLIVARSLPKLACLISFRSQKPSREFVQTEGRLAARADALIALNPDSAAELARSYLMPAERIKVIANGVDPQAFPQVPYAERVALRDSLGLPRDCFLLYSSARVSPVKGQDLLAEALASLVPHLEANKVIWVNTGAVQDTALMERVQHVGAPIARHVRFLPHTEEPHSWLAAADFVVVPSRSESFGLSMLEAAFTGRPVLSTEVGIAPTLLGEGRGVLVKAGDAGALAAGVMSALMMKETQRAEIGAALQSFAVSNFSIKACVSRYADCIEQAVSQRTKLTKGR